MLTRISGGLPRVCPWPRGDSGLACVPLLSSRGLASVGASYSSLLLHPPYSPSVYHRLALRAQNSGMRSTGVACWKGWRDQRGRSRLLCSLGAGRRRPFGHWWQGKSSRISAPPQILSVAFPGDGARRSRGQTLRRQLQLSRHALLLRERSVRSRHVVPRLETRGSSGLCHQLWCRAVVPWCPQG